MKDQLLTVIEALRMARAEIHTHYARRVKNAPRTVERIHTVLFDPKVSAAMGLLIPGMESPSVVPEESEEAKHETH